MFNFELISQGQKTSKEFIRGGSRTAATSKVEFFVIIVNGCKLSTIITKSSILDAAAVPDPHLFILLKFFVETALSAVLIYVSMKNMKKEQYMSLSL